MADYNTLQEAIDAGTTNMTPVSDYHASGSMRWRFIVNHYKLDRGFDGISIKQSSTNSMYLYEKVLYGETEICRLNICTYTEYWTFFEEKRFWEIGKINGNGFVRFRGISEPTYDWRPEEYEDFEVFTFETGDLYIHLIHPVHDSSSFVVGEEEVEITYETQKETDFYFSPDNKDEGISWRVYRGKPELPRPVTPGPVPTPTIIYPFQKTSKYRLRIRTGYNPPKGETQYILSEPSEEFYGGKNSGIYTEYWDVGIDVLTLDAWDSHWTNKKLEVVDEGDVHGLHYKLLAGIDEYGGYYYSDSIAIITGIQTERFTNTGDFPFMRDDRDRELHPYTTNRFYFDCTFTDLRKIFCPLGSFEPSIDEIIFGKNCVFPSLIDYNIFQYPGSGNPVSMIDNISGNDLVVDPYYFKMQNLMLHVYPRMDMMERFLKTLKFTSGNLSRFFQNCYYWSGSNDFSNLKCDKGNADISYMFYYCHDLYGKIDLSGIDDIVAMSYAFFSCGPYEEPDEEWEGMLEEIVFRKQNAGRLTNTGLISAFESCHARKIDLSGFTYQSSTYGVRMTSAFSSAKFLEELDLSSLKMDCSSSSYTQSVFTGCKSLKVLKTPATYRTNYPALPFTMYDSDGNEYDVMPAKKTLYAVNPVPEEDD